MAATLPTLSWPRGLRVAPVLLLAFLAACEGCVIASGPSGTTCSLPDGTELAMGETGPAGDGCNTCICNSSVELACTTRDCSDAGPPQDDAGPPPEDAGPGEDAGPVDAGVDPGPCPDGDGDGYHSCVDPEHPERRPEVDCDDDRFHVQPNGYEFPDTTEDDNCNGANDDWSNCDTGVPTSAVDLAAAMDVCGPWVSDQVKSGATGQFDITDSYQGVIDGRLRVRVEDPAAPPIIIGNDVELVMGTGDAVGTELNVRAGNCGLQDPDPAGDFNGDNICDLASLTMLLDAPPNARGFAFDFMFLSHEWPEYLCLEYNDTFYASIETDAVRDGDATNAAYDSQGRPITVNVGFFENPAGWTVPLDGTPFAAQDPDGLTCPFDPEPGCSLPSYCQDPDLDVRRGSGSGWLTTTVPVVPGEQDIRLKLTIHDEGDARFDSIVIVDGFRWLPYEVELGTEKGN